MHPVDDLALTIGLLAGIAVGLYSIWRYLLTPLWKFIVGVVAMSEAVPTLLDMSHEFHPNEGSSLRDVVDSISTKVDGNTIRLANIEQQLEQRITGQQ